MRLRNVKGSRETIAANDYVVHNETGIGMSYLTTITLYILR